MYRNKIKESDERKGFAIVLVVSALVHAVTIMSLPDEKKDVEKVIPGRVQARVVTPPKPPPKPVVPKVKEVKKEKKVEVKPEKKPEPKLAKAPEKKVTPKKKVRRPKKRRPPRSLTRKTKSPAPAAAPSAKPTLENTGSVTDLGEYDPGATDEEVNRPFDPEATDEKEPEEKPEPVVVTKDVPKDRKAECKVTARYPPGATAVLPATVTLSVRVRANGTVASASVVSSVEAVLDAEAKKALLRAKCKPAIKDGIRVAARIPFRVEFK